MHVLNADSDVADVFVIDNEFSEDLLSELKACGKKPVRRLESPNQIEASPGAGHRVLIRVMEVGLHSVIRELQRHVVDAVEEMAPHVDGVLLGYGLCGNALNHAEDLFSEAGVPVVIPMDKDGPVDDCVGLIIGGRENYYGRQREVRGHHVHERRIFATLAKNHQAIFILFFKVTAQSSNSQGYNGIVPYIQDVMFPSLITPSPNGTGIT